MRPPTARRGYRLAAAAAVLAAFAYLNWFPLDRPAPRPDEAHMAGTPVVWGDRWSERLMFSPYTADFKPMLLAPAYRFFRPSLEVETVVALATGAILLLLSFLAAEEVAGPVAGPLAALLLLCDGRFMILCRRDLSGGIPAMALLVAGTLALARCNRRRWLGPVGAFLLGMAIWGHLLLSVPVAALGICTAAAFPRELARRLKALGRWNYAAAGAFAAGVAPLIYFNARGRWPVVDAWRAQETLAARARALLWTLNYPNPWVSRFPVTPIAMLAAAALTLASKSEAPLRRQAMFAWSCAGSCLFAFLMLPPAYATHHVVLTADPWLQIALAAAAAHALRGGFRPAGRVLILAAVALCLGTGLNKVLHLRDWMIADTGAAGCEDFFARWKTSESSARTGAIAAVLSRGRLEVSPWDSLAPGRHPEVYLIATHEHLEAAPPPGRRWAPAGSCRLPPDDFAAFVAVAR